MKPASFLLIFAGTFCVLTTKDAFESYMEKRAVQSTPEVVSTNHVCLAPEDNDSQAVLIAKLVDCRAQLEELTQQAHDEFDMD